MNGRVLYDREDDEKAELLIGSRHNDDVGYKTFQGANIVTSWRHWLIGPVIGAYIFAYTGAMFVLVEYTKKFFTDIEFEKANISYEGNVSNACEADESDLVYQTETKATAAASTWNVYYAVAAGVPAIVSNLVLGSYTDSSGRKFLLLTCLTGSFIRMGLASVIIYFEAPLYLLLIASFIEGCTGIYATILQVSFAYIADITKPGKGRIYGVIYIDISMGIGITLSSLVSGYLVKWLGYSLMFVSTTGLLLLNLLFVIFLLPETMTTERRRKHTSCLSVLRQSFSFYIDNDSENRRWKFQLILLINALCTLSYISRSQTETLYELAPPFCWEVTKIGVYNATRFVAIIIFGMGSVRLLQKCLDEVWICIIGCVSYAASFMWTAFAKSDLDLYIILFVGCFAPLSSAMQRSMLSHLTPPEKQGAMYSTVGSMEVVISLLSNVMTSSIYASSVSYFRGLAFTVMGGFDIICIILLVILKIGWRSEKSRTGYQKISMAEDTEILIPGLQQTTS